MESWGLREGGRLRKLACRGCRCQAPGASRCLAARVQRLSPRRFALLEVCCASADFAVAAAAAGAHRVELCDNLVEGGTTPSAGAVALAVARAGVPVMAMVRPRGGDFLYSDLELDVMLHDIEVMKTCGVHGVVFGVLTADGRVDDVRTRRLVEAARPLRVTFHRAFDVTRDLFESLEVLCDLGIDRVLTSVGRAAVVDDLPLLGALVERADGRLAVLPGGGVRPANVAAVLAVPGIREVHIGAGTRVPSAMTHRVAGVHMGSRYEPDEYLREEADQAVIASVAAVIEKAAVAIETSVGTEARRRPRANPRGG